MFSKELSQYTDRRWEERKQLLGQALSSEIESKLAGCESEVKLLLRFVYGTMPLGDVGEYDFSVFYTEVCHALMLREKQEWCRKMPEDIFLHYVLYPRINTEKIEACRGFFYEQVRDRIRGKNMTEAVLELNYWCAEHVAYQAADERTLSPMAVYRSGSGRCGEESVFTVAVLRSVGIPARQVYVPRWSHCDDNHAWVEVLLDGKWHFLGACEPEEVLNRGWFVNAAGRAVLVHSRTFSDYGIADREEAIGREGAAYLYNSTARYARTKQFRFVVQDVEGIRAAGASIFLELLNMAEFYPVAELKADAQGGASATLGLGDVHVRVVWEERVYEQWISLGEQAGDAVTLTLGEQSSKETLCVAADGGALQWPWICMEVKAPHDGNVSVRPITQEQKSRTKKRLGLAAKKRTLFQAAGSNAIELCAFLPEDGGETGLCGRLALLEQLSPKDKKDITCEVLEDAYYHARQDGMDEALYQSYVVNPRIWYENLVPYKGIIGRIISGEVQKVWKAAPENIWKFVSGIPEIPATADYPVPLHAAATLRLGCTNGMGRKLLAVAICRSLSIPGRIDPVTQEAQYWNGEHFVTWTQEPDAGCAVLHLKKESGRNLKYGTDWTIGVWKGKGYQTLSYTQELLSDTDSLRLLPGKYRVITTTRMPSGNQHMKSLELELLAAQEAQITLEVTEARLEDQTVCNHITDFSLWNQQSVEQKISGLTRRQGGLLVFLEEGREPTEHVLNELQELAGTIRLAHGADRIYLIVREYSALENETVKKVLAQLPEIHVYQNREEETVEALARRMYIDPEKLPVLLVLDNELNGIYACSGYNVGSVLLAWRILQKDDGRAYRCHSREGEVSYAYAGKEHALSYKAVPKVMVREFAIAAKQ